MTNSNDNRFTGDLSLKDWSDHSGDPLICAFFSEITPLDLFGEALFFKRQPFTVELWTREFMRDDLERIIETGPMALGLIKNLAEPRMILVDNHPPVSDIEACRGLLAEHIHSGVGAWFPTDFGMEGILSEHDFNAVYAEIKDEFEEARRFAETVGPGVVTVAVGAHEYSIIVP